MSSQTENKRARLIPTLIVDKRVKPKPIPPPVSKDNNKPIVVNNPDGTSQRLDLDPSVIPTSQKGRTWYQHLKRPFLDLYEQNENQTICLKQLGISYDVLAGWKKNDPEFVIEFTKSHLKAQSKNNDLLRSSLIRRAIQGTPRYLVRNGHFVLDDNGQKMVSHYEYETALAIFVAKNRMPNEFRERSEVEHHEGLTGKLVVHRYDAARDMIHSAIENGNGNGSGK